MVVVSDVAKIERNERFEVPPGARVRLLVLFPVGWTNNVPATCSFAVGLVVPIPTLPEFLKVAILPFEALFIVVSPVDRIDNLS